MSRELKFRVWLKPTYEHKCEFMDRYGKKLPDLYCRLYTQDVFFDDTWLDTDDYEDIIVEQYTGLKDKNGKEIYEGDIVEFGLSGRAERGYVAYADEYASFEVYSKRDFIFGCLFGHAGKVIGNIHENPELLGGEE